MKRILRKMEAIPIRNKVLAFGIIMSVLPIIIISLYYISFIQVELKEKISQNQSLVVQNLAYEIDEQFKEIDRKRIFLYSGDEQKGTKAIYQFLKEEPSIEEVTILSSDGLVLNNYHRFLLNDEKKGTKFIQWEAVKDLEIGEKYTSKVLFNEYNQPIIYSVSTTKVFGQSYYIVLTIQIQKLLGRIQSLHLEDSGRVYLVDEEQMIIADKIISQLKKTFIPTTDEKMVQFTSTIKDNHWTIVVEREKTFTYEPVSELLSHSILVILILLLIVSIISIQAGMYFTEPILALKKAMRELKTNPSTRIAHQMTHRTDELGELTNTFNEMSQAIQSKNYLLKKETEKLSTIIQGIQADFVLIESSRALHWLKTCKESSLLKEQIEKELQTMILVSEDEDFTESLSKKLVIDSTNQVLQVKIFPMFTEGDGTSYLAMIEDITKSNQLEEKLVQADKLSAIGMMASGFAHEVNNPLTIISVYTQDMMEQLEEDSLDLGELQTYLEKVESNVQRCKKITTNLLNYARPTNWVMERIDLKKELENALFLVEHECKRKQLDKLLILQTESLFIEGDKFQLMQVMVNLLQNAIDASFEGGKITVSVRADEKKVVIEVIDEGIGISKEQQKKLLNPFYTTKPKEKGTGLGLFISYQIIQRFGASMEFFSKENEGTRVVLTFDRK